MNGDQTLVTTLIFSINIIKSTILIITFKKKNINVTKRLMALLVVFVDTSANYHSYKLPILFGR